MSERERRADADAGRALGGPDAGVGRQGGGGPDRGAREAAAALPTRHKRRLKKPASGPPRGRKQLKTQRKVKRFSVVLLCVA